MLDDDDIDFAILAWPDGGWILFVIGVIAIIVMAVIVDGNKKECAAKHCEHGVGMLANHECVCVEKPTE